MARPVSLLLSGLLGGASKEAELEGALCHLRELLSAALARFGAVCSTVGGGTRLVHLSTSILIGLRLRAKREQEQAKPTGA